MSTKHRAGRFAAAVLVAALHLARPAVSAETSTLTAEEIMRRRHPQPVRVGDLVGLPVLDHRDRTIGRIEAVVQTPEGGIRLIVPFGGSFGWGSRPVAVPIETVAILGRHVNALEFTLADFEAAPAWAPGPDRPLAPEQTIRIALGRR